MTETNFHSTLPKQAVLVTGGAGFIGSHLVDRLLAAGKRVVCLDNFSTGTKRNLEQALQNPNFTLISGDIRHYETCRKAVEGISYIFHHAALGSVPRSIHNPVPTNEVNVGGFVNMLTAAKEAGVKRFIYAASSSTYGNHQGLPKVEELIGQPLSPYAVSKYVNELYAQVFGQVYGMETIGLRYFNVFGERQDPEGAYAAVIPRFIKALINGESPLINGDGNHSRDFTYIENAVQANLLAAATEKPEAINQTFNVAYGQATTLNKLMDHLRELLSPYRPEVRFIPTHYGPERAGDIPHSLASIDKARKLLGYHPEFSIREGLQKTVEWFFENSLAQR
ncbi:SDR family oxidoreductase [Nafulsella turpanensis]|uniref:SDR family oxidoreductase n=1 Tax=Nafulsella turpanensis TaxID=1265690 RepID=UPI00034797DD|nr:SDR family oxidoreductase [Nafulsella turpanensis]